MSKNWILSGIFTLLQRSSIVIFGFGAFFFLIRLLDKNDFGTWSLYMLFITLLETTRHGFVRSSQIRFSALIPEEQKILSASLILNIIVTLFVILIITVTSPFIDELTNTSNLGNLLLWYIIIYITLIPFSFFEYYNESKFQFKHNFVSYSLRQGIFFALVLVSYLAEAELTLIDLIYFQIASTFLGFIYLLIINRKILKLLIFPFKDWKVVTQMVQYGRFVFGTSISSLLSRSLDQFMLSYLLGPTAVAIYNPAVRVANIIEVPSNSVATLVFPLSAQKSIDNDKKSLKYLYEKSVGYILAILLPIILIVILFSDMIIDVIAPEGYGEAATILNIYILSILFIPFGRQFGVIFDSMGKQKITFYLILITALINVFINYIFIKQIGILGAAFAMLITFSLRFIVNQLLLYKHLNIKMLNVFKYIPDFYVLVISQISQFTGIKEKVN